MSNPTQKLSDLLAFTDSQKPQKPFKFKKLTLPKLKRFEVFQDGSVKDKSVFNPYRLNFEKKPGLSIKRCLVQDGFEAKENSPEIRENEAQEDELDLSQYIDDRIDAELDQDHGKTSQYQHLHLQNQDLTLPLTQSNCDSKMHLIATSSLPDAIQPIFSQFHFFNRIQSSVFPHIFESDSSGIVVAPTGSGKTAVFEMAIARILKKQGKMKIADKSVKMLYLAPTKSLCSEKYRSWNGKFSGSGISVLELTGDSHRDDSMLINSHNLILTTPEKLDSISRQWRDQWQMMKQFKLVMIDEVHLLNDPSRGHCLEAVISRLKIIQARGEFSNDLATRFLAISATIPNSEDVAEWLGGKDAINFVFDEKARPVQLRKVVLGYPWNSSQSDFRFEMHLSYKLHHLISTYSEGKPSLVFVHSRKGVESTADIVSKNLNLQMSWNQHQVLRETASSIKNTKLNKNILKGIGFHHAGLDIHDRKLIEELFLAGKLPVLISTSTLAMGVNLPAHLVVIKGTKQFVSGSYKEISHCQILQMLGRAGRPQFDTSATAVIMTTENMRNVYDGLISGHENIESNLHNNIAEHINAEIVLGTMTDVDTALSWIKTTFFFVRACKHPKHYSLPENLSRQEMEKQLQKLCFDELKSLYEANIINMFDVDVKPTEAGKQMARYSVALATMQNFAKFEGNEDLEKILDVLATSREFEDIKLRHHEKGALNSLNKNKHNRTIRFSKEGKVKDSATKVNILLQASLGCLPLNDGALAMEALKVTTVAQRLVKCLIQYLWSLRDKPKIFTLIRDTIVLMKSLNCGVWENSEYIVKQFDGIGIAYASCLVNSGITSIQKILDANSRELELIVNRPPPFGNHLKNLCENVPRYEVKINETEGNTRKKKVNIVVSLVNSVSPKRNQAFFVLVGNAVTNELKFKAKIQDNYLISKPYECNINVAETLDVYVISEQFCGNDVKTQILVDETISNKTNDKSAFLSQAVLEDLETAWPTDRNSENNTSMMNSTWIERKLLQGGKPNGIVPKPLNFEALKRITSNSSNSFYALKKRNINENAKNPNNQTVHESQENNSLVKPKKQTSISDYFAESKECSSNKENAQKRTFDKTFPNDTNEPKFKVIRGQSYGNEESSTPTHLFKMSDNQPTPQFSKGDHNDLNPFRRNRESDTAQPLFSPEIRAHLDAARTLFSRQPFNGERIDLSKEYQKPKILRKLFAKFKDF